MLTGLSGSGKSTVGPLLAEALGWGFVDLDRRIEERAGMVVGAIFEKWGELAFRDRESEALTEVLAQSPPPVLATGGGTLASARNRDLAARSGTVVWLQVSPARAATRCVADSATPTLRPLLKSEPTRVLQGLLERREAAYSQAEIVVDTDGLTPSEVAARILSQLGTR